MEKNRNVTDFPISRKNIMQPSKIGAIVTYHKCISELQEYGYIIYKPTYNPYLLKNLGHPFKEIIKMIYLYFYKTS